jgi:hypothetical protein
MNNPNGIRKELASILKAALKESGLTYTELSEQLEAPLGTTCDMIRYGIIESADFVMLCRALGLDACAVLAEAVNQTTETPVPEQYPG